MHNYVNIKTRNEFWKIFFKKKKKSDNIAK